MKNTARCLIRLCSLLFFIVFQMPFVSAQCDDGTPPTGSVMASAVSCGGGNVTLTFDFDEDDEDYNVVWEIGGVRQPNLSGVQSGFQVVRSMTVTTTVRIITIIESDDNDCINNINFVLRVNVPNAPSLSPPTIVQPNCTVPTGSITINASGGTPPLSYRLNTGSFGSNNVFSNLSSGSYSLTVRDASGCEASQTANLNAAAAPVLALPTLVQASCGSSNGSITINASGGTPPLSYRLNTGSFGSNNVFSNLLSGSYSLTVRDASGCEASQTANLNSSNAPVLALPTLVQASCGSSNGSITINASGGTPPLSYRLNTGSFGSNNVFSNLPSGSYSLTVRDGSGCEASQTANLVNGGNLVLNPPTLTQPTCGSANGLIKINAIADDDDDDLTYRLNNGAFQTDSVFRNLAAGVYTITVRDDDGCENTQLVTLTDGGSAPIWNTPTVTQPTCGSNNGSITINATGGTTPYTYRLNSGNFQANNSFSGLTSGNYNVTVRGANGCEVTQIVNLNSANAPVLAAATVTQTTCGNTNGTITVNASGGTAPLSYQLNLNAFQPNPNFSNLASGSYTLTVRDANGCTANQTVILPNTAVTLTTMSVRQPNCIENGRVVLSTTGGRPPFRFAVNGGVFQDSAVFSNLLAGFYTFTCRDSTGCTVNLAVTLSNQTGGTTAANIAVNADTTVCINEQTTLTGNLPTGTTGRWTIVNGDASLSSTTAVTTTVRFNESGTVTIRWTLSTVNCPNYSTATRVFRISNLPDARDDLGLEVEEGKILQFDIAANDQRNGSMRYFVVQPPKKGKAEISETGRLTYAPNANASNFDTLRYAACSDVCISQCDTAMVVIKNRDLCDLEAENNLFPSGITPNGDGKNESLVFRIIDKTSCPFNQEKSDVQIFNRWGDRVFHGEPYDNNWDGTGKNGEKLPVGVYYYVLRVKRSEPAKTFVKFGSVTVFR
jgi:gliding motility-associated-like protein